MTMNTPIEDKYLEERETLTDLAEQLNFTSYLANEEAIELMTQVARLFVVEKYGVSKFSLTPDEDVREIAITKLAIFWMQFHNIVIYDDDAGRHALVPLEEDTDE